MLLDLLFPGVWVHELSHALACILSGVPIHKMELGSRSGKVVHNPTNVRESILISLAPLIVGVVLSFLFFSQAKQVWYRDSLGGIILFWIGFSIAFHSIPSLPDMGNISSALSSRLSQLWKSPRSFGVKIGKSAVYVVLWPLAGIGTGLAWIIDLSLFFRVAYALLLGWTAYP